MQNHHLVFAKTYGVALSCLLFALLRMVSAALVPDGTYSRNETRQTSYGHSLEPVSVQLATPLRLHHKSPRRKLTMLEELNKPRPESSLEQMLERTSSVAETKTEPNIIKNYTPDNPETKLHVLEKSTLQKAARTLMPVSSNIKVQRKTRTAKVSMRLSCAMIQSSSGF